VHTGAVTSIREASSDDYAAVAGLFPELLLDDPMPDHATWLEQLMPTTWVAILDGKVVGYCYVQAFESVGHFQNIVVAPSARQRGIGRALMETAAAWFRSRGMIAWRLNVRADNGAALALYASFGFQRLHSTKLLRLPWAAKARLPKGEGSVRELSVGRDALVEAQFDIPRGTIARMRTRRRLPFEVVDGSRERCIGFSIFDASHARSKPFRALTLDAVAPLLDALRQHAPESAHIEVLVENDARLAAALEGVGASVRLETSVMQAPL
jgi:GNAT superfamily N-acetyltransferase